MPVLESPEEVQPLVLIPERPAGPARRRLRHAAFAADAAHELRTPLTALTLQIQIARRAESPDERAVALDRLEQGVKRATRLVQQLLTMARLDPDVARPATSFDLASVAASVVEEKKPLAEQQRLALALAAVPVTLSGQEDALRILLANLVDNALRYTPPGGSVDVRVAPDGDQARIEVADSGPGIPEEERERVFNGLIQGGRRPAAAAASGWRSCGRSSHCTAGRSHWTRVRPAGSL